MNRRTFLTASLGMLAAGAARLPAGAAERPKSWAGAEGPAVYLTKDISPAGLRRAFDALGARLPGKVGVKVSTGEPGGHNFLSPALVKDLVQGLRANIVECNTAYGGGRGNLRGHIRAAPEHGWGGTATRGNQGGGGTGGFPAPGGGRARGGPAPPGRPGTPRRPGGGARRSSGTRGRRRGRARSPGASW